MADDTTVKKLNSSSLTTALDRLRKGISWWPDKPGWHHQIRDSMYRDCLSAADGNQDHALIMMTDLFGGTLGEMVWRAGDNRDLIIKWVNEAFLRHESSFRLVLSVEPREPKK